MQCTPRSLTPQYDAHRRAFEKFEYLCEIYTKFENTLACLSGAYVDGFESWKKWRSKILWHTSFKMDFQWYSVGASIYIKNVYHIITLAKNFFQMSFVLKVEVSKVYENPYFWYKSGIFFFCNITGFEQGLKFKIRSWSLENGQARIRPAWLEPDWQLGVGRGGRGGC